MNDAGSCAVLQVDSQDLSMERLMRAFSKRNGGAEEKCGGWESSAWKTEKILVCSNCSNIRISNAGNFPTKVRALESTSTHVETCGGDAAGTRFLKPHFPVEPHGGNAFFFAGWAPPG